MSLPPSASSARPNGSTPTAIDSIQHPGQWQRKSARSIDHAQSSCGMVVDQSYIGVPVVPACGRKTASRCPILVRQRDLRKKSKTLHGRLHTANIVRQKSHGCTPCANNDGWAPEEGKKMKNGQRRRILVTVDRADRDLSTRCIGGENPEKRTTG